MLFKFQWTVKHHLEQGRRCGVCLAITAGCASAGGKSCHSPVTWQQGVWYWDQQRTAWTYKHSVVLSIALASKRRVQLHWDSCQGKHAQEAPRGATGTPGDSPVCPWGPAPPGTSAGDPRGEMEPCELSSRAKPGFQSGARARAAPHWLQPQQLRFMLPRLTQQQMAQSPSWLASGMVGVGFLSCASLEWLFNSLSILQQGPSGSLVPCTSLTYSTLA